MPTMKVKVCEPGKKPRTVELPMTQEEADDLNQRRAEFTEWSKEHWCKCPPEKQTFGGYPGDGECKRPGCLHKHHVHCGTCGKVTQIG